MTGIWRRRALGIVAAALGAVASPALFGGEARGELLEVRQVAAGMECPECARGLRVLAREIPGVEAAETSWNRRILSLRLGAGNHVTLADVRRIVLRQHFQVREAEIVVAGRLRCDAAGAPSLLVPESGLIYRIDLHGVRSDWAGALSAAAGTEVVMTGRVPAGERADDPLILWPLDLRPRGRLGASAVAGQDPGQSCRK